MKSQSAAAIQKNHIRVKLETAVLVLLICFLSVGIIDLLMLARRLRG